MTASQTHIFAGGRPSAWWWIAVLVSQQRMATDRAAQKADLTFEIAAAFADTEVHPHAHALEPTQAAFLRVGHKLGHLSASQQRLALPFWFEA